MAETSGVPQERFSRLLNKKVCKAMANAGNIFFSSNVMSRHNKALCEKDSKFTTGHTVTAG